MTITRRRRRRIRRSKLLYRSYIRVFFERVFTVTFVFSFF